ncbi:MAG: hypothetical protein JNM07_02060 [Phycisphaerae bacterium]|nr:hypothetical protein [Phycisphaerae bacterium]
MLSGTTRGTIMGRGFWTWAVMALASAWALLAVTGGIWVVVEWPGRWPVFRTASLLGGVTFLAMGQFLFSALVADRLFPGASQRLTGSFQVAAALVFFAGVLALLTKFLLLVIGDAK